MAGQNHLLAKENRSFDCKRDDQVDHVFLILLLLLLSLGLAMLYSASFAQSLYDTRYESSAQIACFCRYLTELS